MKWFVAEDDFYYSTPIEKWHSHIESKFKEIPQEFESVVRLSKSFSGTKNIVLVPKEEDIEEVIREGKAGSAVFIAPYFPPEKIKSLFFIEQLPNLYGAFTTQEWEYITSFPEKERWKAEREILAEKLGLNIYKPKINTNSLVGMRGVKKYMLSIKNVKAKMLRAKGIFLVGLPGTGKSFSAKVAAATLGWYLVEMNLSKIMESTNPVFALHLSFKHLENLTKRFKQQAIAEGKREYPGFIIWIDEIEKMFTFQGNSDVEKRLFGQLLTILNDMNSDTGYHINGVFWVTANNITQIAENNPEFLRKGRFDELFFVDTPVNKDAEEIFNLYKGVYKFLFYGELFDDRTRLRENLRKARLGRFNPAEKKYMEVKNDSKYTFGTDVVHMIREVFYSEATDTTTSSEAIRFIYTPSEIAQVCKELAIRQKQKITMLSLKRKVDDLEREYKRLVGLGYNKSLNKEKKEMFNRVQEEYENAKRNLREIVEFLYPPERVKKVIGSLKTLNTIANNRYYDYIWSIRGMEEESEKEATIKAIIEGTGLLFCDKRIVLDLVDLGIVCYSIVPLAVSLPEAIRNLRSQAKKFTPAD